MAMATSTVSFSARPVVRPSAAVAGGSRVRAGGDAGAGGGKWWAPLLGWSGKPDYIEAAAPVAETAEAESSKAARRAFLTEDKARELRARMVETESFHDAMYHSAIASRLARSS